MVLAVDAGDMLGWRADVRRAKTLLSTISRLSYDAIGLGDNDFANGIRFLGDAVNTHQLPVTSVNVHSAISDAILTNPPFIMVSKGSVRIGIIGLATPQSFRFMSPGRMAEVNIEDQEQALQRVLPDVLKQTDLIVLLHHAGKSASIEIARKFSDIDLIIGSHDQAVHEDPIQEGQTLIVHTGRNGAYVGHLTLTLNNDHIDQFENRLIPLTDNIADEPLVKGEIETYYASLRQDVEQTALMTSDKPFQGGDTCIACHEQAYNQWRETPHARAFQSLVNDNEGDHPECLSCHTTGYGQITGYRNLQKTDHLTDVQCETCHRVSVTHLLKPENTVGRVEKVSERLCITCHTPVQSSDFQFEEAIEKVRH
jgi:2',3'-cyclic-nucleotide 2'-phosphodiesterase (5'-nucleotidase family)